jgi:hypothetical protein
MWAESLKMMILSDVIVPKLDRLDIVVAAFVSIICRILNAMTVSVIECQWLIAEEINDAKLYFDCAKI